MSTTSTTPTTSTPPSSNDPTQVLTEATHVCYQVLFDRSGSMSSMPGAPAALEEFVGQQRDFAIKKNLVTDFTLTTFETHAKQISNFTHVDLKTQTEPIPPHQLSPSGATRLIDTALEQIKCLRDTLKLEKEKDKTAHWTGIFVLFTEHANRLINALCSQYAKLLFGNTLEGFPSQLLVVYEKYFWF